MPGFPVDTAQGQSLSLASTSPHPQPDALCRAQAAPPATVAPPAALPSPGQAAVKAKSPAPVPVLTSVRIYGAASSGALLPSPLQHGVRPLLAHLVSQQAWGQFADDQKLEMCYKVLKCHPGEKRGTVQR